MKRPSLHLITSGKQELEEVMQIVKAAHRGGIDYLHIREKQRTAHELFHWAESLASVFPLERMIINDRVDVAAAIGCRGAHLAYHSLPPALARRVSGSGQWIGRSVHSFDEAKEMAAAGADYLLYGHIYASGSKPGLTPRGTAQLAQIAKDVTVPIIAIGGITAERVGEVMNSGCAGIGVLSGITAAEDPEAAARAYRLALDQNCDT